MSKQSMNNGDGATKGGSKALIIGLGVVIVALLVIVIVLLARNEEEPQTESRNVLVTANNVDEVAASNADAAEERRALSYTVTMKNTTWTFENGTSASPDSWVQNAPENETDVYFDITINDTGEVIYESPIIPLGQEMDSVTLDKDLDAGTYDCTMTYSLLDDDQVTVLSTVNIALIIIVQN